MLTRHTNTIGIGWVDVELWEWHYTNRQLLQARQHIALQDNIMLMYSVRTTNEALYKSN